MKRVSYIWVMVVGLAGSFAACQKGIETYHGDNAIYFTSNSKSYIDTAAITFAYSDTTVQDTVINITVSTLGKFYSTDRYFKVTVSDSSTAVAGVHYDPLPDSVVMKAGTLTTTFPLTVHRTPDMQVAPVSIILQLDSNRWFTTDIQQFVNTLNDSCPATQYKMWVSDMIIQPRTWLTQYMGPFSRKKVYLTSTVVGLDVQDMMNDFNGTATISYNSQIAWGREMKIYLDQQAAAGTPVYEDNGTLMVMGTSL